MKNHHSIYLLIIQIAQEHHAHVTAIQRCSQIRNSINKNKNKVDFQSTGFVSISLSIWGTPIDSFVPDIPSTDSFIPDILSLD
jgi:hypothetical protein